MPAAGRRLLTRQEVKHGLVPDGSYVVCPAEGCLFEIPVQQNEPELARAVMHEHVEYLHLDEEAVVALVKLHVEAPASTPIAYFPHPRNKVKDTHGPLSLES